MKPKGTFLHEGDRRNRPSRFRWVQLQEKKKKNSKKAYISRA
jgi:hypothetical protein